MKPTPADKRIADNQQPGSTSAEGFLGQDTRSLADIIRADQMAVSKLGLSHQQIADRLRELTDLGKKGLGSPIEHEGLLIAVDDYRGMIPCPFQDRISHDKRLTTCTSQKDGLSIRWSDLNVHMIEAHGFYEGLGSPFRVDPQTIAELLFT